MGQDMLRGARNQRKLKLLSLFLVVGLVTVAGLLLWVYRDHLRPPEALYQEARSASPERAVVLYERLGEELPEIAEYAQLWAAQIAMPDMGAFRALQDVIAYRPQSPTAYEAHIAIARYYAEIEAPEAEDAYRAALALNDTVALRLELARHLEELGDYEGAYGEYRQLLSEKADSFAGMRRTGEDPLAVAENLSAAYYHSDALETLRTVEDIQAMPLRAQALNGLWRFEEAEAAYTDWLEEEPEDIEAQEGLAETLMSLDRPDEARSLYEEIETPDSELALAEMLEEESPSEALELYVDSPYPVAWWTATRILEAKGQLQEAMSLYARLGRTDTYFADDAAYRLTVLADRLGDDGARKEGRELLNGFGLNWLGWRAAKGETELPISPPMIPTGGLILKKVGALELIGRDDLAHLELLLGARFWKAPEVDLAMAEALAERGHLTDAQAVAEEYIEDHSRAPVVFWELSYPRPYSDTVESAAAEFELDPLLIWAVMRQESRYDPEALSYAGARGLMQVMPATQDWIAEQLGETLSPGDAYDPRSNVRMAAWLLRFLLDYYDDDLDLAIAAYNGGGGSVDSWQTDPLVTDRDDFLRWIGFGETREYVERVSLFYWVYQQLYASAGA